jgi:hypothetical protein
MISEESVLYAPHGDLVVTVFPKGLVGCRRDGLWPRNPRPIDAGLHAQVLTRAKTGSRCSDAPGAQARRKVRALLVSSRTSVMTGSSSGGWIRPARRLTGCMGSGLAAARPKRLLRWPGGPQKARRSKMDPRTLTFMVLRPIFHQTLQSEQPGNLAGREGAAIAMTAEGISTAKLKALDMLLVIHGHHARNQRVP